jgi:starch phosphorylase
VTSPAPSPLPTPVAAAGQPIAARLPERIRALAELAQNLWWSWQLDARELFRAVDARLWERTRHNPLELLTLVAPERLARRADDAVFLERYEAVLRRFRQLSGRAETWYARRYGEVLNRPLAYFSAEFALHRSLPIYSGGLGVLAGDLCKEASDLGVPLVGIGLCYYGGYFDQQLGLDGWQRDADDPVDTGLTPLVRMRDAEGGEALVTVVMWGREVHVGAWKVMVGRVPIYLLDTRLEQNDPQDRELTARLYSGAPEWRLRQEWVLGLGGVRLLRKLGIEPAVWHANEGHAGFMYVERLREHLAAGLNFRAAENQIRASSVFTTHTPVPAGHDTFAQHEFQDVAGPFWNELGITREQFFALGATANDSRFQMTVLALRLAGRVNGVSVRHREESRRIWRDVWADRPASEIPIGCVTNGVHLGTWMARPLRQLLAQHVGPDWDTRPDTAPVAAGIRTLDDSALWAVHETLRQLLHNYIREEARHRWRDFWKDPAKLAGAGALLSPHILTIGFARRFATYKRADLLFRDPDRLRRLLTNPYRPVQIIFAGKAHPADDPGKRVLQRIFAAAQDPSFEGRIAFLEDYEMHLAQRLVRGVDLWFNLPRVPLEACGTSGMKAALNGVPQLSTLDGWWAEGFNGENGWAIPLPPPDADPEQWDMEHTLQLLEREVVPRYYDRAIGQPYSTHWVQMMKAAIAVAFERFTARQMLQSYVTRFYIPAAVGEALPGEPPPR